MLLWFQIYGCTCIFNNFQILTSVKKDLSNVIPMQHASIKLVVLSVDVITVMKEMGQRVPVSLKKLVMSIKYYIYCD